MGLAFHLPLARCYWGFPTQHSAGMDRAVCPVDFGVVRLENVTFISQEPAMVFDGFLCARKDVSLFTFL